MNQNKFLWSFAQPLSGHVPSSKPEAEFSRSVAVKRIRRATTGVGGAQGLCTAQNAGCLVLYCAKRKQRAIAAMQRKVVESRAKPAVFAMVKMATPLHCKSPSCRTALHLPC